MDIIFIYTLTDPRTNQIRYVGQTKNTKTRFYRHIFDAKQNGLKNKRCAWIKSLLNKNLKPKLEILDEVPIKDWIFWEQYWICQINAWGFKLVNSTSGGEGSYNRIVSQETKYKMSIAKKGKKPKNYDLFRQSTIKDVIVQYDLNGLKLNEFESSNLVKKIFGIKNISSVLNKKRCSAGGFIWRFKKDILTDSDLIKIKDKHFKQKSKKIFQLTNDGILVKEWDSVNEIKKIYPHINAVLSGKRKTAGGFIWKYKSV